MLQEEVEITLYNVYQAKPRFSQLPILQLTHSSSSMVNPRIPKDLRSLILNELVFQWSHFLVFTD
jgi:hypothetical protein